MKFTNVSVITCGPALGHGVCIDQATLDLVASLGNEASPVKVFPDHDESVTDLIGAMTEFRVDGDQVKADLELIAEHPLSNYYAKILDVFPESIGFSISWAGATEQIDGVEYCRPTSVLSVDLVSRPAANPQGVYSARTAPKKKLAVKPSDIASEIAPQEITTIAMMEGGKVDSQGEITMANPEVKPSQEALAADPMVEALAPIIEAIKALNDKVDSLIAAEQAEVEKEQAEPVTGEMAAKLDAVITKLSILEEAGRGTDPIEGEPEGGEASLVAKFEAITSEREKLAFVQAHPEIRKALIA